MAFVIVDTINGNDMGKYKSCGFGGKQKDLGNILRKK